MKPLGFQETQIKEEGSATTWLHLGFPSWSGLCWPSVPFPGFVCWSLGPCAPRVAWSLQGMDIGVEQAQ